MKGNVKLGSFLSLIALLTCSSAFAIETCHELADLSAATGDRVKRICNDNGTVSLKSYSDDGQTETSALPWGTGGDAVTAIDDLTDGSTPDTTSLFVGNSAGANDDGTNNANVAFGPNALSAVVTGTNNTAIGRSALQNNTVSNNTAVGVNALATTSTGSGNVAVGNDALAVNTASANTALGSDSLGSNTSGANNTAVGRLSLQANTTGSNNTAVGAGALRNSTANANVAVGQDSLRLNTTGSNNTAIGTNSLEENTTASFNTAIGDSALKLVTGARNVGIGASAITNSTTGIENVAVGTSAMFSNTTGRFNSALGDSALGGLTTGADNIGIGEDAGQFIADGTTANETTSQSIFLGADTRASADGVTNEIVIGDSAIGSGSNTVTLGNSSITTTVLNGKVGIGTSSPAAGLHFLQGTAAITPNGNADTLLLEEGSGNVGLTIANSASAQGSVFFGNPSNATAGRVIYDHTSNSLRLATNSTERLRIDSSGNVGIGTTSPTASVHVVDVFSGTVTPLRAGVRVDLAPTSSNGFSIFEGSGYTTFTGGTVYGLNIDMTGSSAGDHFGVYIDGEEKNYFSGNVGIGTATPSTPLQISLPHADNNGDLASFQSLTSSNGSTAYIYLSASTSGQAITRSSFIGSSLTGGGGRAQNLLFGTSSINSDPVERMRIDSNGNVGIGTTSPQATLDVDGIARLADNSSEPVSCAGGVAGSIALTSSYEMCVCNGTNWVEVNTSTACTW